MLFEVFIKVPSLLSILTSDPEPFAAVGTIRPDCYFFNCFGHSIVK